MKGEVFCLSLVGAGGGGNNLQVSKNQDNIEDKKFRKKK